MTPERVSKVDGVLHRRQPDLTLIAENLYKSRNLSAVVRTCDAVGIDSIHVVPGKEHPRRHWHTSQGAEKWIELNVHESTAEACTQLKSSGFTIVAAHLSDRAVDYREFDYTQPTALLMGTEAFGVSEEALHLADQEIVIPMMGMSQSLNVSVACAVVLYEALAQRKKAGMYDTSRMQASRMTRKRFEWLQPKMTAFCRERNLQYPALDADGDLLEDPAKKPSETD